MKKCMIVDKDGSFLHHAGTVLSDSAFEWNGDARRNLGDHMIPVSMRTRPDGTRLALSDVYTHPGES